jgi:plasmid maintenance system antidote protein VapI
MGPGASERLDRLGSHLAMAALRLARLRPRLDSTEDRLMLIQARYDLDEAIAEVRRLALAARQMEGN